MTRLKMGTSENDVKKLVKAWYEARQGWSYAPIQRGMGEHGIPDRVGCVPITITQEMVGMRIGLFVAVEAKKPGRRGEPRGGLEPMQYNQLLAILTAKGIGALVDSTVDLDWLSTTIRTFEIGGDVASNVLARRIGNG